MKKTVQIVITLGILAMFIVSAHAVVINEVLYDSGAAPDFIELYNLTGNPIVLDNWEIQVSGSYFATAVILPASSTIPANGYFLVSAGDMLPPPDVSDVGLNLAAPTVESIAGVRLLDDTAVVIDTVLYGDAGLNPDSLEDDDGSTDSARAALPIVGDCGSLTRDALHSDSDNSLDDFIEAGLSPTNSNGDTVNLCAEAVVEYEFTTGSDGWTSYTVGGGFTDALFDVTDGALVIQAQDAVTHGIWEAPRDSVEYVAGSLYRATFTISTTTTDPLLVPGVRMRMQTQSSTVMAGLRIDSFVNGVEAPGLSPKEYVLYFDPMDQSAYAGDENTDDMFVTVDIMSFTPGDDPTGALIIDKVVIDRIDAALIAFGTSVYSWNTTADFSTWVSAGASPTFTLPLFSAGTDSLTITADNNALDTYGFWESARDGNEVDIVADLLYKATWTVSSTTALGSVPMVRLRLGTESNQMAYVYVINSNLSADNSPDGAGVVYQAIMLPPQSDVGADIDKNGLIVSMDMLNFGLVDAADGNMTLESVEIETVDPNLLP